jgi:hypothetical protein
MPFPSEDDDRSCGNFWQRAKRRLRWARRRSHEITTIHLRAALLSRRGDSRGRAVAITFAHADAEAGPTPQTDRAGEATAGRVPLADGVRKTIPPFQGKILPTSLGISVFRFLSISIRHSKTFQDKESASFKT